MKEKEIIEIPFGAFDSELCDFEYTIPEGHETEIKDGKVIVRKTKSEDEKIRKELIDIVKKYSSRYFVDLSKHINYLKKQGEQKPVEPTDLKTWVYIVDAVLTEENGIGNYLDKTPKKVRRDVNEATEQTGGN